MPMGVHSANAYTQMHTTPFRTAPHSHTLPCMCLLLQTYAQIVQQQRQWAIVQVQGFDPVIYVNCLEGDHPVEVLRKGLQNDFWQEAPVTGGSGGGANHPNGVILLGPEGLAPFRDLLSTPPPPDNVLKPDTVSKLTRGTLRVVPPTTYLKMCRAYRKKMNTNKNLKVVGPGHSTRQAQSVADFFQYRTNQAPNQGPATQQSPQQPIQPTAATSNASSQPLPRSTPTNNIAGSQRADTPMNATLVTAASHFEGMNASDTANTANAAAALNQMGSMSTGSSEGHAAPSISDPRPSSSEGDRLAETPAAKRQRVESRFEAVQGLLQQKHQAWMKAAHDAEAIEEMLQRKAPGVQENNQENPQQRELVEVRQQIQQLQAKEQSLMAALGEVEETRRRERQEFQALQAHAEQLRAAEAAAETDLQSFFEAALGPAGRSQGQP
ncbi:hypothetical protein DUNSADRAFT_1124 [Dunaliella salina]|uniref:Uncharacterized protein n=1 Tax=Dunaliella salina TaxID=3046 RepID=A0ABQ7FXX4_DUNSA|nr:hypothetical protein DUNSADRAFT_1124 [Dunaliella salina]|eukprot:KAF5827222.1 hypothetical protein DUNSADRAFT_1124 [Dunaliella salina]